MSKESWLQNIEKKLPWGFFSVLLAIPAIFLAGIGVTTALIEKKPDVEYQILNAANVLDLHTQLQDLKILFKEEDIQKTKKNLQIYTMRIANVGRVDILESHFDSQKQWGIEFSGGEIVQTPRMVDSNSEYLKDNIEPTVEGNSVVAFNKIIFERGKYFTVETLVLHDKDTAPTLTVLGKIAGIDDPQIVAIPRREVSFFGKVFYGNWLVQLVRAVLYVIGIFLFLATVGALAAGIRSIINRRVRKRLKKRLARYLDRLEEQPRELVARLAAETDCNLDVLKALLWELADEDARQCNLALAKEYFDTRELGFDRDIALRIMPAFTVPDFFAKTGDGEVTVDESAVSTLRDLIQYLESGEVADRTKRSIVPSQGAPSDDQ